MKKSFKITQIPFFSHCQMWYCGQPPWLLQGTIKDNILMGNMWCPQKYARVLRATGLRPDLQILPGNFNFFLLHAVSRIYRDKRRKPSVKDSLLLTFRHFYETI